MTEAKLERHNGQDLKNHAVSSTYLGVFASNAKLWCNALCTSWNELQGGVPLFFHRTDVCEPRNHGLLQTLILPPFIQIKFYSD